MLVHIYLFLEENFQKALRLTEQLADQYRENSRYPVLQGVCQIRSGRDADYRLTLENLRHKEENAEKASRAAVWRRRALYLEAVRALYDDQYTVARQKLNQILSHADSEDDPAMIAWPRIKIAMSYDLQGRREEATERYHRILEMDNAAGAQFLAKKLLEEPLEKNDPFIGY
jgi:tetratricopeptide (TPR) repeat protein